MKTDFTKGEWRINPLNSTEVLIPSKKNQECPIWYSEGEKGEAESNALLIASAPDLFMALQKAIEIIDRLCEEYSSKVGMHASYTNGESWIIEGAIEKAITGVNKHKK